MPRPNGPQFKYIEHADSSEHEIAAFNKKEKVGRLIWHKDSGEIQDVFVNERLRRRGIATAMWDEAHKVAESRDLTYPEHSAKRTTEGDRWARSVGGQLPPLVEWSE